MPPTKRNEKYLKQNESGACHLVFLIPARFGGKFIRQSLFTDSFGAVASIRDIFVVPTLIPATVSAWLNGVPEDPSGNSISAKNRSAIMALTSSVGRTSDCYLEKYPAPPPGDHFLQVVLEAWEDLSTQDRAELAAIAHDQRGLKKNETETAQVVSA